MFCCVRQLKLPLNQSYLPSKCVSLRTQSYPRTPHGKELAPVLAENLKNSQGRRSREHVMLPLEPVLRHEILPYADIFARELKEFSDDLLRLQLLAPGKTLPMNEITTSFVVTSEARYSAIGHNVMVLAEGEELHNTRHLVKQTVQRLTGDFQSVCCSSSVLHTSHGQPPEDRTPSGRPSEEQLVKVQDGLVASLPRFFQSAHNFRLYHQNLVFHDNITRVTTRGLPAYMRRLLMVRCLAQLKYFNPKLLILKVTYHMEDGTVRLRWRVTGVPGIQLLLTFWKREQWKSLGQKETEWIDGFSIFHVGPDGLIYKHICDKVMPDENVEKVMAGPLGVKLAGALGLVNSGYIPT